MTPEERLQNITTRWTERKDIDPADVEWMTFTMKAVLEHFSDHSMHSHMLTHNQVIYALQGRPMPDWLKS